MFFEGPDSTRATEKSEETKIQFRFIYIAPFQGASYCKVKTTILERNPTIRLPPLNMHLAAFGKKKIHFNVKRRTAFQQSKAPEHSRFMDTSNLPYLHRFSVIEAVVGLRV